MNAHVQEQTLQPGSLRPQQETTAVCTTYAQRARILAPLCMTPPRGRNWLPKLTRSCSRRTANVLHLHRHVYGIRWLLQKDMCVADKYSSSIQCSHTNAQLTALALHRHHATTTRNSHACTMLASHYKHVHSLCPVCTRPHDTGLQSRTLGRYHLNIYHVVVEKRSDCFFVISFMKAQVANVL